MPSSCTFKNHASSSLRSNPVPLSPQWWAALIAHGRLWRYLAAEHIEPVFPSWTRYTSTAFSESPSSTLAVAAYHIFSPNCFYCGEVWPSTGDMARSLSRVAPDSGPA